MSGGLAGGWALLVEELTAAAGASERASRRLADSECSSDLRRCRSIAVCRVSEQHRRSLKTPNYVRRRFPTSHQLPSTPQLRGKCVPIISSVIVTAASLLWCGAVALSQDVDSAPLFLIPLKSRMWRVPTYISSSKRL